MRGVSMMRITTHNMTLLSGECLRCEYMIVMITRRRGGGERSCPPLTRTEDSVQTGSVSVSSRILLDRCLSRLMVVRVGISSGHVHSCGATASRTHPFLSNE
mmetsp:Transcript_16463/g.24778  ORF Transcript_16463/g.24778 Transcript_16463/m.24778 type:complete len:102 (+) Transcript_16463:185-490(+)